VKIHFLIAAFGSVVLMAQYASFPEYSTYWPKHVHVHVVNVVDWPSFSQKWHKIQSHQ